MKYVWPTAIVTIATPSAWKTVEAVVFQNGPHDIILGNIRGVRQFNVEVMNNTEQIRHQPTTQRNEQADNTIGDLQAKMDKLILEMNSVIADFS